MRLGALEKSKFLFQLWSAPFLEVFFQPLQTFLRLSQIAYDQVEVRRFGCLAKIIFADVRMERSSNARSNEQGVTVRGA